MASAGYLAAVVLFLVIAIEETGRFHGIKGRFPDGHEWTVLGIGVLIETIIWIIPLATKAPAVLAIGELFVGLAVEHAVIRFATNGTFELGKVLDFTATEALGGGIWLTAPSVATVILLTATSIFEHVQGLRQAVGLRA